MVFIDLVYQAAQAFIILTGKDLQLIPGVQPGQNLAVLAQVHDGLYLAWRQSDAVKGCRQAVAAADGHLVQFGCLQIHVRFRAADAFGDSIR